MGGLEQHSYLGAIISFDEDGNVSTDNHLIEYDLRLRGITCREDFDTEAQYYEGISQKIEFKVINLEKILATTQETISHSFTLSRLDRRYERIIVKLAYLKRVMYKPHNLIVADHDGYHIYCNVSNVNKSEEKRLCKIDRLEAKRGDIRERMLALGVRPTAEIKEELSRDKSLVKFYREKAMQYRI